MNIVGNLALSDCDVWEKPAANENWSLGRLHYNYFRYYDPATGRYITSDPIGLEGDLNTYGYVYQNPTDYSDPSGLYTPFWHKNFTLMGGARAGLTPAQSEYLARKVVDVDYLPGSQNPENAHMHAMCAPGRSRQWCQDALINYINKQIATCLQGGLAKAIHAAQDFYSRSHSNFQRYEGFSRLPPGHIYGDSFPSEGEVEGVPGVTQNIIERFKEKCPCKK